MNPALLTREQIALQVQMRCVDMLIDDKNLAYQNLRVDSQFMIEPMLTALRLSFRYPAHVLQNEKEVARWPATRWDNFLVALGLNRWAKFKILRVNEALAFPKMPVPDWAYKIGSPMIVYDMHVSDK